MSECTGGGDGLEPRASPARTERLLRVIPEALCGSLQSAARLQSKMHPTQHKREQEGAPGMGEAGKEGTREGIWVFRALP